MRQFVVVGLCSVVIVGLAAGTSCMRDDGLQGGAAEPQGGRAGGPQTAPQGEPAGGTQQPVQAEGPGAGGDAGGPGVEAMREFGSTIAERVTSAFDGRVRDVHVDYLGTVAVRAGHFVVFSVRTEGDWDSGESGQTIELAFVVPRGEDQVFLALRLGESTEEPGASSTAALESFENLRLDHGMVRAEVSLLTGGAEFDTCPDCQAGREGATLRRRYSVICDPGEEPGYEECYRVPLSLEVVSPPVLVDDDGNRHPDPDAGSPDEFTVSLVLTDAGMARITLESGTLDPEYRDLPGERYIAELGAGGEASEVLEPSGE